MAAENVTSTCDMGTLQLPISRIKTIMKSSPEVSAIGTESLFLIAKATVRLYKLIFVFSSSVSNSLIKSHGCIKE